MSCTALENNQPDQKRPATALGKFLLKKNQSRLTDLALNITPPEILQHPPFFTGQHLKITACNKKTTEKRKPQQPPPVQAPGGTKLQ
jgi:hypothetical protein